MSAPLIQLFSPAVVPLLLFIAAVALIPVLVWVPTEQLGRVEHFRAPWSLLFEGDDIMYLPRDRVIPINQTVEPTPSVVLLSKVVEHFIGHPSLDHELLHLPRAVLSAPGAAPPLQARRKLL